MSFDFKKDSSTQEDKQLSLLDYQMPEATFNEEPADDSSSSQSDYHTWALAHKEPETSGAGRFLTFSATVHIAAAVLIAIMSVPFVEKTKTETITIEIEDTEIPKPKLASTMGAPVLPSQGGAAQLADTPAAPATTEDIVMPQELPKALPEKAKAHKVVAKAAPAKATKSVAAKTNFQAVPATIDDLDAPTLDDGDLAANNVKSEFNEDFNEDLDRVDMAHQKSLAQEKESLNAMAAAVAAEQENELKALDEDAKAESEQMQNAANELKQKNAQAVAKALATERAEAARVAQAQAAAKAAADADAAAKARKAAAQGQGHGNGQGQTAGKGAGHNGDVNVAGDQLAGNPQGVRSLDQLRQMPGNPRPQYDRDERLRGHQGEVAFLAYISKSGSVTQFRQVKSTGFRNLDSKTLAALKKWRFYPGQEGWVELPFKWDLKGGSEQDGGLLRAAAAN